MSPSYVFWAEKNILSTVTLIEIVQYIIAGILYVFILTMLVLKNGKIFSNYNSMQTDFVQWSEKNGRNPNKAYWKTFQTFKLFLIPCLLSWFTLLGPFFTAINNRKYVPLDDRSNFIMFLPKVSKTILPVYKIQFDTYFYALKKNTIQFE